MAKTIGIIGYGNMGSAMAERLKADYSIIVFDKDKDKISGLDGMKAAESIAGLLKDAQIIILAVKPQDFDTALEEINGLAIDKLFISIAAGINTGYIEKKISGARVIRAMPNLGIRIGQGLICLSKGNLAAEEDFDFVKNLFSPLGRTMRIEEKLMHAATAVCGSGPAYVCEYLLSQSLGMDNTAGRRKEDFLDNFQKAAIGVGFSPADAAFLVNNVFSATVNFLRILKLSPEQLIRQVASKGGTTEAALVVLRGGGSLEEAVKAALRRAEQLSKKE